MSITALIDALHAYRPACVQEQQDRALMLRGCERMGESVLTRENPLAHFTASAWVVDPSRERVVMVYHKIYRSWSWSGGHADGESDLLRVALREVREETGLQTLRPLHEGIWSLEALAVAPHTRRGQFVSAHLHWNLTYLLEAQTEETLRVCEEENSAVRWFAAEDVLPHCTEPQMRPIYQKLIERLRRADGALS